MDHLQCEISSYAARRVLVGCGRAGRRTRVTLFSLEGSFQLIFLFANEYLFYLIENVGCSGPAVDESAINGSIDRSAFPTSKVSNCCTSHDDISQCWHSHVQEDTR